jgi:hypothetical protein
VGRVLEDDAVLGAVEIEKVGSGEHLGEKDET